MKLTVMLTAAALMFTGMTSLGLANENTATSKTTPSVQGQPAASTAPAEAKPVANVGAAKQPVAMNEKSTVQPSKEESISPKVAQSSSTVSEKTGTDKEEGSTTSTPEVKEKNAEQKPTETPAAANPTK